MATPPEFNRDALTANGQTYRGRLNAVSNQNIAAQAVESTHSFGTDGDYENAFPLNTRAIDGKGQVYIVRWAQYGAVTDRTHVFLVHQE